MMMMKYDDDAAAATALYWVDTACWVEECAELGWGLTPDRPCTPPSKVGWWFYMQEGRSDPRLWVSHHYDY